MDDALAERVEALERAVTDGEHDLSALATEAEALDRLDSLEEQCGKLETRIAELEAATQALRGYVGNVRAVNEEVENKAETALAKVESLEADGTGTDGQHIGVEHAGPVTGSSEPRQRENWTENANQPKTHRSEDTEESHGHCVTCGRARPFGSSGVNKNGKTERGNSLEGGPRQHTEGESLRESDPLLTGNGENDTGALSRFKQLL